MGISNPLVSVIMPAYNSEKYIEEAILSVQCQTINDFEIIVVDDCSEDSTCDIVRRLADEDERILFVRNKTNGGTAYSRNNALEICKGRYVAFLDSDDIWYPDKLKKQIERMEAECADISYSSYAIIDADGEKIKSDYIVPEQVSYADMLKENVMGCSTVMVTKELIQTYKFTSGFQHEDYLLWLQLLKDGYNVAGCSEVLAGWRYLQNSKSFNKWNAAKSRWRIYRKCMKLPFVKSAGLILHYAAAGLRKYR